MNLEMKRIGTISLDKDVDVNKIIYDNPKLGIKLAKLGSKYENENRFAIYTDGSKPAPKKKVKKEKIEEVVEENK